MGRANSTSFQKGYDERRSGYIFTAVDRAKSVAARGGPKRKAFSKSAIWGKKRVVLEEQNGQCLVCGVSEWQGFPLVLELDHIDGNNKNNVRENLRVLCPNCHSQTPTFRGRKNGKTNGGPSYDGVT